MKTEQKTHGREKEQFCNYTILSLINNLTSGLLFIILPILKPFLLCVVSWL